MERTASWMDHSGPVRRAIDGRRLVTSCHSALCLRYKTPGDQTLTGLVCCQFGKNVPPGQAKRKCLRSCRCEQCSEKGNSGHRLSTLRSTRAKEYARRAAVDED